MTSHERKYLITQKDSFQKDFLQHGASNYNKNLSKGMSYTISNSYVAIFLH